MLGSVFINRDTNGESVLKVGTTLIRVSTVMGILYNYLPPEYEDADFQVVQKNKNNGIQLIGVQVKNPDRHRQSGNRSGGSIAGRKRRNDLLELVWIWRQGRVVCLLCVLVCRPERLYSEWSHSEIFSLFGRCEVV